MIFKDRKDAGQQLACRLQKYAGDDPLILALPRGGVVVGHEIARQLDIPLDILVVRKIGAPHNPEFGIGALAEGNVRVVDTRTIRMLGIQKALIEQAITEEEKELERRVSLYRNNKPLPLLHHKTIILVDDGLATGVTARAAIKAVLQKHPRKFIFAVPVCAKETVAKIRGQVDDFICLYAPPDMHAIGAYYQNFTQTTDREVIKLLKQIISLPK